MSTTFCDCLCHMMRADTRRCPPRWISLKVAVVVPPIDLNWRELITPHPSSKCLCGGGAKHFTRTPAGQTEDEVIGSGLIRPVVCVRRRSGAPIDIGAVKDYVDAAFVR